MTVRCRLDEAQRLELICETIRYCQSVRNMGGPAVVWRRALREAVYFTWETRRGGKIMAARYRSTAARGLAWGSHRIVYEHAIPLRIVQGELMDLADPAADDVRKILDGMLVTCIITVEEDQRVNQAGLGRTMPPGWDGMDRLARYHHVGIETEENPDWAFATVV